MDETKNLEDFCMNIEFLRCKSTSKEAKAEEFWKYLDNQGILKPHEAPKLIEEVKINDLNTMEGSSCTTSSSAYPKKNPKKIKTQIKKSNKVEKKKEDISFSKYEKYFREDLHYADFTEISYDEINAELAYFQKQLLKCKCNPNACKCEKEESSDNDD